MSYINQNDADKLFQMEKKAKDKKISFFPVEGQSLTVPLVSLDKKEEFLFDINRGSIDLKKVTYQSRARKVIILRRLDIKGPAHRNPDVVNVPFKYLQKYNGVEIPCPHMHIYIEGFNEKWAIPASLEIDIDDQMGNIDVMNLFLSYCNVIYFPKIQEGLFI